MISHKKQYCNTTCKIVNLILVVIVLSLGSCASYDYAGISGNLKEIYPGQPEGYLKPADIPNSTTLLPPPPEAGSAAMKHDIEISEKYLSSNDTMRWNQAGTDANLEYPSAIDSFVSVLNVKLSVETAPYLYLLLERSAADATGATAAAKIRYRRQRPFMVNNLPTCSPASEEFLRTSGSYPSGHSAIGWSWALILCELFPDQVNAILKKGREFSESRVVCNVHWYSDVEEGRFMGSATVAALHGNSTFQHDLEMARKEIKEITGGKSR